MTLPCPLRKIYLLRPCFQSSPIAKGTLTLEKVFIQHLFGIGSACQIGLRTAVKSWIALTTGFEYFFQVFGTLAIRPPPKKQLFGCPPPPAPNF